MRVHLLILVCATAILGTEALATDWNLNSSYQQDIDLYRQPIQEEPTSYSGLFQASFDQRSTNIFQDQFQPYNFSPVYAMQTGQDPARIRDYDSIVARHALSSSVRSSARHALLALDLPVLDWIRDEQGFLARFLWNSLDSADEESVSPRDPGYRPAEYSWWKTQMNEGHLSYGLRPFSTAPYAFIGGRFKDAERVLFLWDARYYFRNFGDHCFELTLAAPLTRDVSVQLGTSYQFGTHEAEKKVVLKLLKTFRSGGFLSAGLEVQEHPMLVASLTVPW